MAQTNNFYFLFVARKQNKTDLNNNKQKTPHKTKSSFLISCVAFSTLWSTFHDFSLQYVVQESTLPNTEKSVCVFLGGKHHKHHKTTGRCPSLSWDESLIISSFQLEKSSGLC